MDEVKIKSKLATGLVSKIVKLFVHNKLGYDVDIQLNEFRTTIIDEKTHVHLDVDLDLSKDELDKLIKSIGL